MDETQLVKATEYAGELRKTVSEARDYSKSATHHDLFIMAETIIGTLAFLIAPMLEWEHRYRELKVKYIDEGNSVAQADAKARASTEYRKYREIKMTYDLADEAQKMIKKFSDKLELEYQRTR